MNRTEKARIVSVLAILRPDWNPESLASFLDRPDNLVSHRPYADAVTALVYVAVRDAKTPELVNKPGPWHAYARGNEPDGGIKAEPCPRCHETHFPTAPCRTDKPTPRDAYHERLSELRTVVEAAKHRVPHCQNGHEFCNGKCRPDVKTGTKTGPETDQKLDGKVDEKPGPGTWDEDADETPRPIDPDVTDENPWPVRSELDLTTPTEFKFIDPPLTPGQSS